jgi:galactokinase
MTPVVYGVAPGRVEILGNHTDYNAGAVLTAAIDRHIVAVGRAVDRPVLRARSLDLDDAAELSLTTIIPDTELHWSSYLKAVFGALERLGLEVGGMELIVLGNIPIGAGLSSSAAFEAAVARAVLAAYGQQVDPTVLARGLQQGENHYAGVQCGLLDQFSSICGRQGRVLYLDCATCEYEALSLGDPPPAIVVADSRVSRVLGRDAPYNQRRAECEEARTILEARLGRLLPGLCHVSRAELETWASEIPEPALFRARHVIGEHERVHAARDALGAGDVTRLGALFRESHASSQRFFDNSCEELDRLCVAAAAQPGVLGARLCGGGWGGCTVNLVEASQVDAFVTGMDTALASWDGPRPVLRACQAADGATGGRL